LHKVIDESNYRSLFNLRVSNFLNLHYLPNSFRLPFRNFYYQKARKTQPFVQSLQRIDEEYSALTELYFDSTKNNLQLPFFLAAVLSRISKLDEFFEVLAETRLDATQFRAHRVELDEALERGDIETTKKLRAALRGDSKNLQVKFPYAPVAGATAAVLAALAAEKSPQVLAAIAILTTASGFKREDLEKLKQRVFRRQFWFLADMKDAANGLTSAYPKIRRLWGLRGTSESYNELAIAKYFKGLRSIAY
jgi:hypothetical protein